MQWKNYFVEMYRILDNCILKVLILSLIFSLIQGDNICIETYVNYLATNKILQCRNLYKINHSI